MSIRKLSSITQKLRTLMPLAIVAAVMVANIPIVHAAPTVSVTSPLNSTVQQGAVTLTASASADTLGVTFKVSGAFVSFTSAEDTTAPFSTTWDSSGMTLNKLDYTITAVARGADGSTTSAPVKVKLDNSPFPGKTIVVGDSVSQQAYDWDADGTRNYTASAPGNVGTDFKVFAQMGWDVPDVQQEISNHSVFRWPQKLVVAMGLNDAGVAFGADGWTSDDTERFRTLLDTVHTDTCVTLVLPGHAATGNSPWFDAWTAEIGEARTALAQLATERPLTTTIDWQTVVDAHPEYVDEDGIHLKTDATDDLEKSSQGLMNPVHQDAAEARQNFYWDGAAQCEDPSAAFQAPADNATVAGTVPLEVNATSAQSVQFQVDGQNIGSPVTSAPYQLDWDSTTLPNGTHTITAVSTNQVGSHTTSITVNVQNPPVPGSVGLIGDSVTYNSLNSSGLWYEHTFFGNKPENLLLSYWPGWTHTNSQATVNQWATNRTPEILIDAFGFNDAKPYDPVWNSGDGFTEADRANVLASLDAPHASSCKVLVLPGWGSGLGFVPPDSNPSNDAAQLAYETAYIQELLEVRAFYSDLAAQRSDIVTVDWQPIADAHPEYMDPDGIHLAHKPAGSSDNGWRTDAAEARQNMYWDGVAQCQTLLTAQ